VIPRSRCLAICEDMPVNSRTNCHFSSKVLYSSVPMNEHPGTLNEQHHSDSNPPHHPDHLPGSGNHGPHDHPHGHDHELEVSQEHDSFRNQLIHLIRPHSHSHHAAALDPALANDRGIWALKISLTGLLITAIFQVVIVAISGSVALLADTLHNFSDAMTAIPLGLAFVLARRASNRRYTYGYGRAEDLAGVLIVLMIFGSAVVVFYESIQKIIQNQVMSNIGWVAAASIIGFVGNELVAIFRIRVGREIGSAALIADGLHARTDGLTSLGVLAGAVGVWLGFPLADPLMGLAIGFAILVIVWGAAREIWLRIMDAIDPALLQQVEKVAGSVEGVMGVKDVTLRWLGHRQRGKLHIIVNCQLPTVESHRIAENVRHELFHALPALVEMTVHVDPCECDPTIDYHPTNHHLISS
jgi:cation diffusion facilitator family transporter